VITLLTAGVAHNSLGTSIVPDHPPSPFAASIPVRRLRDLDRRRPGVLSMRSLSSEDADRRGVPWRMPSLARRRMSFKPPRKGVSVVTNQAPAPGELDELMGTLERLATLLLAAQDW
jgi:hypothetical protein